MMIEKDDLDRVLAWLRPNGLTSTAMAVSRELGVRAVEARAFLLAHYPDRWSDDGRQADKGRRLVWFETGDAA